MIDVFELTKIFPLPGGSELKAIDRLSFSVGRGEVFGLLGPNGAGKTTTIRILLGLMPATSGEARIDGFRSSETPEEVKRRVGLVSAHAGLYQWLTVRESLEFYADLYAVQPEVARTELERLSELMGIRDLLERRCSGLSTGQKQRIHLVRALIHSPPVLLLDEPTVGLDVLGSQVVTEYVAHLRDEGKAVILCTHRMEEAERLCDRMALLHRGRIVAEGRLEELRSQTGCHDLLDMFLKLSGTTNLLSRAVEHE